MKHRDPKKVGRKGFIWLTLAHGGPSLEEVRTGIQAEQKLEAGTDTEAMEDCCLLACSACFLWNPGPLVT